MGHQLLHARRIRSHHRERERGFARPFGINTVSDIENIDVFPAPLAKDIGQLRSLSQAVLCIVEFD